MRETLGEGEPLGGGPVGALLVVQVPVCTAADATASTAARIRYLFACRNSRVLFSSSFSSSLSYFSRGGGSQFI